MVVKKRTQVTEVVTSRMITHDVEVGEVSYKRIEKVIITIPFTGCKAESSKIIITWAQKMPDNTFKVLSADDIGKKKLNAIFDGLSFEMKNFCN